MTMLILDSYIEEQIIHERQARGIDHKDEVWNGTCIITPPRDVEHQELIGNLTVLFYRLIESPAGGNVYPGLNLSDRIDDWTQNYRCPDVVVLLAGGHVQVFEEHIRGPADFLVEIVSPDDKSRDKLGFYADLGVRELLVIDRYPWSLELYRLRAGEMVVAGQSSTERGEVIESAVLPLSFQLLPAEPRPEIRIAELGGTRNWIA